MSMIGDSPKSVALYDTYTKGQTDDIFPLMGGVGTGGVTSVQEVTGDATAVAPPFYGTSFIVVEAATATITIPSGVPVGGRVHVRKIHATQGAVTIVRSGTDTITRANLTSVKLNADGDHWLLQKVSSTRWELVEGVESGSNANGEYERSSEGSQTCLTSITFTVPGNGEVSGPDWVYPSTFSSTPYISGLARWLGVLGAVSSRLTIGGAVSDAEYARWGVRNVNANQVQAAARLTAIGRWYA